MIRYHRYDPFQFDGEGGTAAPAAQDAGTAPTEGTKGTDRAEEGLDAQGKETKETEKKPSFRELLKDPAYKQDYDAAVREQVQRRIGDVKGLQEQLSKYSRLESLLRDAYEDVPQDADIDGVIQYLEGKNDIWADAAARAGMPVEAYKNLKRVERENAMLVDAHRAEIEEQRRAQKFAEWDQQIPAMQQLYPSFDIAAEVQNPQFVQLIDQGWSLQQAYEGIHHREIMSGAIRTAAQQAAQQTAKAIRSGQGRPIENAVGAVTVGKQTMNPAQLTDEEMDKLIAEIKSGRKVSFD